VVRAGSRSKDVAGRCGKVGSLGVPHQLGATVGATQAARPVAAAEAESLRRFSELGRSPPDDGDRLTAVLSIPWPQVRVL